jgi:flagella basal body P-ring formation protein FlgA
MRNFLIIVGVVVASVCGTAFVRAEEMEANITSGSKQATSLDTKVARLLKSELERKYSEVIRWSIVSLPRQALIEIPGEVVPSMQVTHIGSRSAVELSWADARSARQVRTLWFNVEGAQSMVVAAHDVAPAASLSIADAMLEERDVMALGCSSLNDPNELQQMRTRRALRSGTAICREAIEPRPAVARGENVTVRYSSERVSITSKGIAQDDGQVGQRLRVINPISKDSFLAVVSAAREVLVHE